MRHKLLGQCTCCGRKAPIPARRFKGVCAACIYCRTARPQNPVIFGDPDPLPPHDGNGCYYPSPRRDAVWARVMREIAS